MFEKDQHGAYFLIVQILNDIDGQIRGLETVVAGRGPAEAFRATEANVASEQFFYSCQVAEERIKEADMHHFITREQVEQLNSQLQVAVLKMITLS